MIVEMTHGGSGELLYTIGFECLFHFQSGLLVKKHSLTSMMDLTAYVSHLGHVIKFDLLSGPAQPSKNSEDLIFSESEKWTVNLQATSFKFSSERRSFQEEMQTRTCVHGCEVVADGKIVLAECVRESHTGLVLPCVLVQSRVTPKDFVTSFFLYSPTSNRIFLCGKVTTKHAIPQESAWLIDGPSACWTVDELNGFLFIKKDAESGRFGLHRFVDDNKAKGSTIMHCSLSPEDNLRIITIPQLKVHADNDSVECRWVSLILNSKQERHFTKSNQFVPDVYASIACCMLLMIPDQHDIPHGDSESFGDCLPLQEPPLAAQLKNTAYVATSMKQLLKLKNGVFCKLVSIPFDDAVEIVPMDTRGDKMLVVRSKGGAVCVVSCSSFQVIQEWKNVSSVYIDDILGNGRDQLLMLLKPSEDPVCHQPFPEFILTDLDLCHVASNDQLLHDGKGQRSGEVQSVPTPKSLVTAMQALEAKVENGLTSLREQELSRQLKDRIISQSMENLAQMVTGVSNPIQKQQTLVHLCGTTPTQPSLAPPTASDTGGRLKVTAGWQRIVNEKWVIGCKVTNENQWPVADVKLLVLPWKANSSREPVECEGYIKHPKSRGIIVDAGESESHRSSLVPPSKRSRLEDTEVPSARDHASSSSSSSSSRPTGRLSSLASPLMPGESCDAVATTAVPDFLDGPVASRLLVLQWTTLHPLQREQSGTNEGKVMSMICGHVRLGAADLMGQELAIKLPEIHPMLVKPTPQQLDHIVEGVLSRTDELALDASQLSTSVRVTSRYTHLPNLHKVLFRDMGFQEMGGGGGTGCLCNCTDGGLRGARVYLDNVRSNSAQLRVLTRDKRERMLFFHTLKSFLPVDVQFTLDTPTDHMEEAIKSSVTSMNNELQHMLRITDLASSTATGVNEHKKDGEGSRESPMEVEDGGESVSRKQERLKRLREDFLKQQETAKYKDCTLAGNQAELLRTKLLELRENTDNAVTVLSKCI